MFWLTFLTPGDTHEPEGFILTTLLGIAGAFVMTYLGQALGWYQEGQATGRFGATLGAVPNPVGVGLQCIQETKPLILSQSFGPKSATLPDGDTYY